MMAEQLEPAGPIARFLQELRDDPELAIVAGYAQLAMSKVAGQEDYAVAVMDRITAAWERANDRER
jgi:hypothetical protein